MKVYSSTDHHQGSDFSSDNAFDSQILGPSDSLTLPSEPPDIGNWFSSYVYESPVLDTNDDFGGRAFEESEIQKEGFGIEGIDGEKEDDIGEFKITVSTNDLEDLSEKIFLNGYVKSSHSDHDKKIENQCVYKGNQLHGMDILPSRKTFRPSVGRKTPQKHDNSSMEVMETSGLDDEGSLGKPEVVLEQPGFMSLNINKYSAKNDGRSLERLLCGENLIKESSEAKAQREKVEFVIAEINLDSVRVNGTRESPRKRNDKENGGNKSTENGFISTRKNKILRENEENFLQRPQQEKFESSRNVKAVSSAGNKDDAIFKRKALSERTNLQSSDALEIAGKWKCPQRSKPNLGPPLKQLRLEQWVRRI